MYAIQSTSGAVSVRNEKGQEVSIEKVKVSRYVSGKRPDYAPKSSSEDESEEEEFGSHQRFRHDDKHDDDKEEDEDEEYYERKELVEQERLDPRLRRLMTVESGSRYEDSEDEDDYRARHYESEVESEEEELDVQEMERRRAWLRQRALEKRDEELLAKEHDKEFESDEESESEYEEYTDCEEESRPRFKPVFVRKEERVTVKDKDNEETAYKQQEQQSGSKLERRKETLKLLEEEICKERRKGGSDNESKASIHKITDVNTDEENEEVEYAAWKLRELKRLKRARDEREAYKREQEEIQRLRNMTDEERRLELKLNPKVIVNQASKGKYKFMQKYYHRGVFFMDKEDKVFMKDFSQPTLEDKFDKTTLPKIMQVKKFGKRGCTKYTHLTDQDTTNFDSAWGSETAVNMKFHTDQAAGVRPVFQKPTLKRSKSDSKK